MEALPKGFENAGAIAILAILIFRLPAIVSAFNAGVQLIINNVMSIQDKALAAFKDQNEKEREYNGKRFEKIENGLEQIGEALNTSMEFQKKIMERQDRIEDRLRKIENK